MGQTDILGELQWLPDTTNNTQYFLECLTKPKKKSAPQTLSSMATKLVNWDRMENSLLSSMMKCFSSAFFPWEKPRQCEKLGIQASTFVLFWTADAHTHTHAPRVQLRPSPGFRLQNPEWGLLPWACEETAHKRTHTDDHESAVLWGQRLKGSSFFFLRGPNTILKHS